jgi:hypothetical protein
MEETIPEDVWTTVRALPLHGDGYCDEGDLETVARAVLAERHRSANVAKAMLVFADTTSGADEAIYDAILDPEHWLAKNPSLVTTHTKDGWLLAEREMLLASLVDLISAIEQNSGYEPSKSVYDRALDIAKQVCEYPEAIRSGV